MTPPAPHHGTLNILELVYIFTGVMLWLFAGVTVRDREHPHRYATGLFWLLLGTVFAGGSRLPHAASGAIVLAMVTLDGLGWVACKRWPDPAGSTATAPEDGPIQWSVFLPVLTIPTVTGAVALAFRHAGLDSGHGAVIGMGAGSIVAAILGLVLHRDHPRNLVHEGRRINEIMGAVSILPQLLASLGAVFVATHLGELIATGFQHFIPPGHLFPLIVANCCGMALLSALLGNSFAAFPIIASGVTVPLLIRPFGVNPALAALFTLTAGASGTLMTPMAANFNLVPTALLGMKDEYGVIVMQIPVGLAMLLYHIVVMWLLVHCS